ncbi:MAG: N-acetyltransferase family protein [Dehalococcoidales bacterium]|jgi:phosphinothricin acetyltransferase
MTVEIRKAVYTDVPAITGIYNEAILTTTATFDKEPKTTTSQRKWFKAHGPKNPIVVAVADGKVVGWASLSAYSDRCAYAETAEISVYVKESFRNQGLGKKLMQAVLDAGKKAGLHTVISRIAGGNNVSINLHHELGFTDIGVMKEVGSKFGQLLDVYLLQKMY